MTFLGFNAVYAMCNPTTPPLGPGLPGQNDVPLTPGPELVKLYMLHLYELYGDGQRAPPDGARALPPPPSEGTVDADAGSNTVLLAWTIGLAGLVRHPIPSL